MSNRHATPTRSAQYEPEHSRSTRKKGDRINNRPASLKGYLRWAQDAYALEPPPRLHDRDIADDGAPDHTPEAKRWLGMSTRDDQADDWIRIACKTDEDGFYRTPMRCAIERVPGKERRALLKAVLPNLFHPFDAAATTDIPEWCIDDVMYRALSLLWDRYADRPLPRRTDKSDNQLDAEAAA